MNIFVLIMVIGASTSQSGLTTINQEFSSYEKCESVRKKIEADLNRRSYSVINSQGCYFK